jgi:prolipoprotein diacylglyceryltransferase
MYPNGLFGLDALRVMISPIAIFGTVFFILYLRNDHVKAGRAALLLVVMGIFSLLGAKLFSLYVRDWEVFEPLSSELRGGLRYPGAVLSMIIIGPLLKRWLLPDLPLPRFLDVLAITVCLCLVLMRFSCFMNGCCTGPECTAIYCAWYVQLQEGLLDHSSHPSNPVLPLHFLFMAASLGVGVFLIWFDTKRSFNGQIGLLFLVLHDGAKGILESFRVPYVGELQLTSLSISAAALIALISIVYYRRVNSA